MRWFTPAFIKSLSQKQPSHDSNNGQAQLAELHSDGVHLSIDELILYQGKTTLIDLAPNHNVYNQMSGNYLARSKGCGMEFDEVRHYQHGDDIRTIDWRVTARTGKAHTKLFREEVERPVLIATDVNASMNFGSQLLFKSVQAGHLAALVAWHAKARGDRIGGIVFNQHQHSELKPRSRKQGVLHYLHALQDQQNHSLAELLPSSQTTSGTTLETKAETNATAENNNDFFTENCTRLRLLARPGSLVYLITDGYHLSAQAIRHLSQISQHCELVICLITDPLEQQLPKQVSTRVSLTDGKQNLELMLGDKTTQQAYQQAATAFQQTITGKLSKTGARLLNFSSAYALEQQLKPQLMQKSGS